jgi:hypothetical protein
MKATPAKTRSDHSACRTCGGTGFVFVERERVKYVGHDGQQHVETSRWAQRCPELDSQRPAEPVPF